LDDDEIEFLDDVQQSKRAEEERVRRETEDGLKHFREAQRAEGGKTNASMGNVLPASVSKEEEDGEEWNIGRKRKRHKERESGIVKGVKRRTSDARSEHAEVIAERVDGQKSSITKEPSSSHTIQEAKKPAQSPTIAAKPKLGLVDYGSDDSDDD
jgi:hypothetical protein